MRKIPLFALLLVSASFLSGSYHQTSAIGIDSSSHGLLYGGRVVRRYGNLGNNKNLFNKRYSTGLQGRADPNDPNPTPKGSSPKGGNKDTPKDIPKDTPKDTPTNTPTNTPKDTNTPKVTDTPKATSKPTPKTKQPTKSKATPTPNQQSPQESSSDDTTTPNTANSANEQAATDSASSGGTPTVATGGLSTPALAGLASIGGVFVLVAGLFAFGQRRKNKEMTKSIVSTSAKAWEQQNSTYEKMEEEEAEPIGSYTVIATYTPTLADELDIQPGDKVTILVEFDDGWVQGINETRGGTKGVFPRHCVDMDHASNIKNIKRSSSMGVFSEKYTEINLN